LRFTDPYRGHAAWVLDQRIEREAEHVWFYLSYSIFLASEIRREDKAQHTSCRRTQVIDRPRKRERGAFDDDSEHQRSLLRLSQSTVDTTIPSPPACLYLSSEEPKITIRELRREHEPGKPQYQYRSLVAQITSLVHTSDFSPSPREHPWSHLSSPPAAHPSSRLRRVSPSKTSTSLC
jgi:hypothetical protein